MKRTFRAVLSALLCLLIVMSNSDGIGEGISVRAEATELGCGSCGSNAEYRFNDESGVLTISGSGAIEDYNYSLSPFYDNTAIRTVVIEKGITRIGSFAFARCTGITRVDIPNSVEIIGEGAFSRCSGLAKIILPESIEIIGKEAFIACTGLKKINIPKGVLEFGVGVFTECTGLTCISVDEDNPRYDSRENCNAVILTASDTLISGCSETVISKSVTAIGKDAFRSQIFLKNIVVPDGLTDIGDSAFRDCTGLEEINLPDSIENIGVETLYRCTGLTKITIPKNVTEISEKAFSGCSSLTELKLHDKITVIGRSAFSGCSSLTDLTIPNSVTAIGEYAFFQCTGIENVTVPANVSSIGRCAFSECTALSAIRVDAVNQVFDSRNNCNAVIRSATNTLVIGCLSTVIDSSVTSISEYAFYHCTGLTSIDIPKSVKSIGSEAFSGVANINYYGTASGSKWGAENINCYAEGNLVYQSAQKKKIVGCGKPISGSSEIPNSVTGIGAGVFEGCSGITEIIFSENLKTIGDNAFSGCTGLKKITIPDNVREIGSNAFYECTGLESIALSDNLESIGEKAFYHCGRVMNVRIPDCVRFIGVSAFENVLNIVYHGTASGSRWGAVNYNCYVEGSLIYSDSYKRVIVGCRRYSAGDLFIPASVTNIAVGAFNESSGITAIYIDSNNPEYDNRNNCNAIIHTSTNTLVLGIQSTVIPEDVSCIAAYAFCNCKGLKNVVLPESVTEIDEKAFYCCSDLEGITLTDKVESIGEYAFYNCTSLKKIEIPDFVKEIGGYAFAGCSGLTEFSFPNGIGVINKGLFSGCGNLEKVTVPQSVGRIDNLAFEGCLSLESVNYSGTYAKSKEMQILNKKGDNNYLIYSEWHYYIPETITVSVLPDKTVYHEWEALDLSGIRITADYAEGFSETIDSYFTFSPSVTGSAGTQRVTVAYMGREADFEVAVEHDFRSYVYNCDESVGVDGTETAKCENCDETHTRVVSGTAKPFPSYRIKNRSVFDGQTVDYRTSIEISAEAQNCSDIEWFVSGASFRIISEDTIEIEEARDDFSVCFTAKDLDGTQVISEKETVFVKHGFFDRILGFFRYIFGRLPEFIQ